eukprot:11930927-Alexandrium_andersonii.AAC.1
MARAPHMAAPPLVERRVVMHPAKSVSAYTVMGRSPSAMGSGTPLVADAAGTEPSVSAAPLEPWE